MRFFRGLRVALVGLVLVAGFGCTNDSHRVGEVGPSRSLGLPPGESAKANIAVAQEFDEAGKDREAIRHYELARDLDPKNFQWVARRLSVLYDRVGDAYRAEREYEKALNLEPNDPSLLNDYGYFNYSYGRLERAEEMLRRAIEIDPGYEPAWMNLGLTLGTMERYEEAFEAFRHSVSPAEAHANVAVLMTKNGDYERAEGQIRLAIAQQPDLSRYHAVLEAIRLERTQAGQD